MAESVKKPKAKKAKAPAKTATRKTPARAANSNHSPSHEEVSQLARKYWAEGGYRDGHHEEDWYRAERELRSKAS